MHNNDEFAGSATSAEALQDPYNIDMVGIDRDFFQTPYLHDTITDSHYTQRNRHGRHVAFLARMAQDYRVLQPKGIGMDEKTALAIDQNGKGWVYGPNNAYFLIQSRSGYGPEVCKPQTPLTWYRNEVAVQVYVVPGTPNGTNYFDLVRWNYGTNASVQYWYADKGNFYERSAIVGVAN